VSIVQVDRRAGENKIHQLVLLELQFSSPVSVRLLLLLGVRKRRVQIIKSYSHVSSVALSVLTLRTQMLIIRTYPLSCHLLQTLFYSANLVLYTISLSAVSGACILPTSYQQQDFHGACTLSGIRQLVGIAIPSPFTS
jgi:hypothetical protein